MTGLNVEKAGDEEEQGSDSGHSLVTTARVATPRQLDWPVPTWPGLSHRLPLAISYRRVNTKILDLKRLEKKSPC